MSFYEVSENDESFDVYDDVWIVFDNQLIEMMVCCVSHEVNFEKTGVETWYKLGSLISSNSQWITKHPDTVFKSRQLLIDSLNE